jgi:uncharacterized membrane protein (UPF0127 family)
VSSGAKAPLVRLVREDATVVCERCAVAATPFRRLKGLLGRAGLEPGEGLLIRPTSSIHMFFMRFPIDALFLDGELVVRKVVPALKPWRIAFARGAKSVVELRAGEVERRGVGAGDRLILEDV